MEALHKLSEFFAHTTTLATNKTINAPTHAMKPVNKFFKTPVNSTWRIQTKPHVSVPRVTPRAVSNHQDNRQQQHMIPQTPPRVATQNYRQSQPCLKYMAPPVGPHRIPPDDDRPYNLRPRTLPLQNKYVFAAAKIATNEANAVIHQDTGKAQEYRHLRKGPDK